MLDLPPFVLACPATIKLILRAIAGEVSRASFDAAWDDHEHSTFEDYSPSQEVQLWTRHNWSALVPSELSPTQIPTLPTVKCAPVLSQPWMEPFLAEYIKNGGVVIQAAKAGPIHRDTVYEYLKHDPEFARAFADAEEERKGVVRSTVSRRAIDGWEEPVYGRVARDQDGVVGTITKFDNRLLLRLAESCLPEFAGTADGTKVTVNTSVSASALPLLQPSRFRQS